MREILFGRHAVLESLRAGRRSPYRLLLSEGTLPMPVVDEIEALAKVQGLLIDRMSCGDMARAVGHELHQGVALETSEYPYVGTSVMLDLAADRGEAPLLLLLDLIQDIHNLGSLMRTAEAVGAHGVILQDRRAAGITPAAVNTSSGAAEHLLVAQVTNLPQEMVRLKAADVWMVGLEEAQGARLYTESDLTSPLGLVVGSESDGLRRLVRERCDWMMRMPMYGKINSLNASIAGSIALYEVLRQRHLAI
jgi:23S rRNA (guanosine2251-2'-O)-methyltransferase